MKIKLMNGRRVMMDGFNNVRWCYYTCSKCGKQIDSYTYYCYGKCDLCRV